MIGLRLFSLSFLLFFSCSSNQEDDETTYSMVIKNAMIIDGTGKPPFFGQIIIAGDTILRVDKDTTAVYHATQIIDAGGRVVTPGFIDTHAHGDPVETPEFKNFLAQGVTTICLGQDGFSPEQHQLQAWMDSVDAIAPGVNIALFAGHNTLRMLSGIAYDTIVMPEKQQWMEKLLVNAMQAGCFGMTTGLEYTPGYYAGDEELVALAKIVGERQGLIMSHMRNEDDTLVEQSIHELILQGRYCPVHVSHIKVVYGKGSRRADEILQLLDSARAAGVQMTADIYPYTASYTGIGILFPDWAKNPNDYQQVLAKREDELARFLRAKIHLRNGPDATLIGTGLHKGKTLAQISSEMNLPFEDVLMHHIGPYGASGAYFIMDEVLQDKLLGQSYINICTDGSPGIRHPRGYGSFAKIIEEYVYQKKLFTLEEAVFKMTGLPAQTLGLKQRGLLQEGFKADLLIFHPKAVKENATYEAPHTLATGMDFVIVNGKVSKVADNFAVKRSGKILRKD